MPQNVDPQIAVLIANMQNLSEQFGRILESQARIERAVIDVAMLQKDQEHISENLRQLNTIAEVRSVAHHQLDKRVLILERWHRLMLAQPAVVLTLALAALGYGMGFMDSLTDFKDNTRQRIQALEFVVNSPAYERAMSDVNKPAAAGSK